MVRLLDAQESSALGVGPVATDGSDGSSLGTQVSIDADAVYFCDPGSGITNPMALAKCTAEFAVSAGACAVLLRTLRIWRSELDRFLIEAVFEKLLARKAYLPSDGTVIIADAQDIRALTTLFHVSMLCEWQIECYCDGPFQAFALTHAGVLEFHIQGEPGGFPDAFEQKTGHRLNVMRPR
ncbi:MAG: hypothetical protein AAF626_03370 [Pseudomonadota bacterium]